MRHWAASKEFSGMLPDERDERLLTIAHLEPIAARVLASGDCIFDVSRIGADLLELELPTIEAQALKLPRAHAFFLFGQQPCLQVDVQLNLFIEGAYVSRSIEGDGGIDIILVGNDPTFAGNDNQPTGEFLRGVSRYAYFTVPGHKPVASGPFQFANDHDGSLFVDRSVITCAVTLALQAVQYLHHPLADVAIGYDQTAPQELVTKAKARYFEAQLELDWQGYPSMIILGNGPAFRRSNHPEVPGQDKTVVFGMGP
ncbi:hypothetical protein [Rhizobium oryzicola]|uniref:Uncharacterized protein n=1 Tax=Rhizobium oryzicola TaxID=1232668 RepID=A0ABT8SVI7_9HYPH|nr:hypothetical protein [Rhizobium oryzicola]MDO1582459.1 hypothetical protein [Rhizobium oryzicola]